MGYDTVDNLWDENELTETSSVNSIDNLVA